VHLKGKTQPELCVRTDSFNHAIAALRAHGYGTKMKNYRPPTDSVLGAMIGGLNADIESPLGTKELEKIHYEWKGFHLTTQNNLLIFEEPGFQLPDRVSGVAGVKDVVSSTISPL
jgi:hypothetical protein